MKGWAVLLIIVAVGLGLYFLTGNKKAQEAKTNVVSVSVARAVQRDTLVEIEAIGTAQPYAIIKIKSLVDGQLESVGFSEGKLVHKDQILFEIDDRPFKVQLQQAKANLARDEAQLSNALKIYERAQSLRKDKYFSQQDLDQLGTNVQVLKGTIELDKAAIASAELQLEYCTIRSPVTGYTGPLQFDVGNIIQAKSETPLVTINQVLPIYVSFSVAEQYLSYIKSNISQKELNVDIYPKNNETLIKGTLTFVNNTVDVNTGSIQLKATVENTNKELWPGEFVNIKLPLQEIKNAILIPTRAIQAGPNGFYVFIVNSQKLIELRNITVGPILNNETIVMNGLKKDEIVVTAGHLKLSQGTEVNYELTPNQETQTTNESRDRPSSTEPTIDRVIVPRPSK